jgi:hypothetical protein
MIKTNYKLTFVLCLFVRHENFTRCLFTLNGTNIAT